MGVPPEAHSACLTDLPDPLSCRAEGAVCGQSPGRREEIRSEVEMILQATGFPYHLVCLEEVRKDAHEERPGVPCQPLTLLPLPHFSTVIPRIKYALS